MTYVRKYNVGDKIWYKDNQYVNIPNETKIIDGVQWEKSNRGMKYIDLILVTEVLGYADTKVEFAGKDFGRETDYPQTSYLVKVLNYHVLEEDKYSKEQLEALKAINLIGGEFTISDDESDPYNILNEDMDDEDRLKLS